MTYDSTRIIESVACTGVTFTIVRMSFARRLELARRVRALAGRLEFAQAGSDGDDKVESAILAGEIDKLYIEWGLVRIDGLQIDGYPAEPSSLLSAGPEDLCREIVAAVKRECGLTQEERKN